MRRGAAGALRATFLRSQDIRLVLSAGVDHPAERRFATMPHAARQLDVATLFNRFNGAPTGSWRATNRFDNPQAYTGNHSLLAEDAMARKRVNA